MKKSPVSLEDYFAGTGVDTCKMREIVVAAREARLKLPKNDVAAAETIINYLELKHGSTSLVVAVENAHLSLLAEEKIMVSGCKIPSRTNPKRSSILM
jgi:hypothetical protein